MKALAKEQDDRPASMEALGQELQGMGAAMFPGFGSMPAADSEKVPRAGVLGVLRGAAATSGLFGRSRGWQKNKMVLAAGGVAVLAAAFAVIIVTTGQRSDPRAALPALPPVAVAQPVAPPVPPPPAPVVAPTPAPAAAEDSADGDDEDDDAADAKDGTAKRGSDTVTRVKITAHTAPAPAETPRAPQNVPPTPSPAYPGETTGRTTVVAFSSGLGLPGVEREPRTSCQISPPMTAAPPTPMSTPPTVSRR
jgi:hypothetical protein